ncbi:hypothetical protein [Cetobacterium sp. SF1]|uniref:hypothetical protein n=1 Tax=Cetobacterium sp. SF1 TaxID=3417654 RepID=UPI003CECB42E
MRAKYFKIQELVSRGVYEKYGERAWTFMDKNLIETLDTLREFFNSPIYVNDWAFGGALQQRGLRANKDPMVIGKKDYYISAHCLGKAADISIKGYSSQEVFKVILENSNRFPHIKRIEDINSTPTWVHIDLLDNGKNGIHIFKP